MPKPEPRPLRTLPERAFHARARLVAALMCCVCFAGLAARLAYLQLFSGDWYASRALGQQLRDTVVPADRGRIYSADGVLLAANSSCWTLRASPREMPEEKLSLAAQGLAEILELDEAKLLEKFSDRASNDCLLRYRVERDTADRVRDFCEENGITGIRINQDSKRWYPEGEFLASVLGFTNVDNAGVSGLELKYNDVLTGQNGVVLTAVNAWGYTLEQSYETEKVPLEGSGLRLTVDANIQHYLENALDYAVKEHHVAARAVGIVMDVNTGAVLAMSTTPAYDPNQPRVIYDAAARTQVLITKFGAEKIIFSGIAGNMTSKIGIGDVVIGKTVLYHDAQLDMICQNPPFLKEYTGDPELIAAAEKACAEAGVKALVGKIATGDLFVGDSETKAAIEAKCAPDCVEMEGAAVSQIAAKNGVPCVILRAMSDNADEDGHEVLVVKKFSIAEYVATATKIVAAMVEAL